MKFLHVHLKDTKNTFLYAKVSFNKKGQQVIRFYNEKAQYVEITKYVTEKGCWFESSKRTLNNLYKAIRS